VALSRRPLRQGFLSEKSRLRPRTMVSWTHRQLPPYRPVHRAKRVLIRKFKEHGFAKPIRLVRQPVVPFPETPALAPSPDAPFVYFGRLSEEKGINVLIRALSIMGAKTRLRIVGDGPARSMLEALAADLDISDRVEFVGHRSGDDLWSEVDAAKAVVFPSVWYENMPYAVLEAMARRKLVIASRIGGIPEVVRDHETGLLFEPGDHAALADILDDVSSASPEQFASFWSGCERCRVRADTRPLRRSAGNGLQRMTMNLTRCRAEAVLRSRTRLGGSASVGVERGPSPVVTPSSMMTLFRSVPFAREYNEWEVDPKLKRKRAAQKNASYSKISQSG